jgi:hypothetical protein
VTRKQKRKIKESGKEDKGFKEKTKFLSYVYYTEYLVGVFEVLTYLCIKSGSFFKKGCKQHNVNATCLGYQIPKKPFRQTGK